MVESRKKGLCSIPRKFEDSPDDLLSPKDQMYLSQALGECCSYSWDVLGTYHFKLSVTDIENIESDHRERRGLQVSTMIDTWCRQEDLKATLARVVEILDKANLNGIKQKWWIFYKDPDEQQGFKDIMAKRTEFVKKFVTSSTSAEVWTKFLIILDMEKEGNNLEQEYPRNVTKQRLRVLEMWGENKGYHFDHEKAITSAWEKALHSDSVASKSFGAETLVSFEVEKHDVGLLHCDADKEIATRMSNKLRCFGHSAKLYCDFSVEFGQKLAHKAEQFYYKSWCILWIATNTSVQCKGYDEQAFDIMYDLSIKQNKTFFPIIPEGHRDVKLPKYLQPYQQLFEDDKLEPQISAKLRQIKGASLSNQLCPKAEGDGGKRVTSIKDFEEIEFLGSGAYGRVMHAVSKIDKNHYALKVLEVKATEKSDEICNEAKTMKSFLHDNIVRYISSWTEPQSNLYTKVYIQMEYCKNGTLKEAILNDLWKNAIIKWQFLNSEYFRGSRELRETYSGLLGLNLFKVEYKCFVGEATGEVLEGLKYIHQMGWIHRDLKPANIFLDENNIVKVGDWGMAAKLVREASHSLSYSAVGTHFYKAPEIINSRDKYDEKVDIYSVGVIFFEMSWKRYWKSVKQEEKEEALQKIRNENTSFANDEVGSEELKIIRSCLSHNAERRYSAEKLLTIVTEEVKKVQSVVNQTVEDGSVGSIR